MLFVLRNLSPPQALAGSFFLQPRRAWDTISAANFQRIERLGQRLQMFAGQVQVDKGVFQAGVAE
jgi:hypothetical protein